MNTKRCAWTALIVVAACFLGVFALRADRITRTGVPFDWLEFLLGDPVPPSLGELGHVVNGKFVVPEKRWIWEAPDDESLVGVDPAIFLYAQIEHDASDCPVDGPPRALHPVIKSFRVDGVPNSAGVRVRFDLIERTEFKHTYRSVKPLILMSNPRLEAERADLVAIYSEENCYTQIVWD